MWPRGVPTGPPPVVGASIFVSPFGLSGFNFLLSVVRVSSVGGAPCSIDIAFKGVLVRCGDLGRVVSVGFRGYCDWMWAFEGGVGGGAMEEGLYSARWEWGVGILVKWKGFLGGAILAMVPWSMFQTMEATPSQQRFI